MALAPQPVGRRERNKQNKLERITAAARELFAEHGVDEVTTQQIADKADIGAGTLFLYAKTKGELLLLVQNTHYAEALERGRAAADGVPDAPERARRRVPVWSAALLEVELPEAPERRGDRRDGSICWGDAIANHRGWPPADAWGG